jgi:HAD superfamily hydrolase (TIGR01549 family)
MIKAAVFDLDGVLIDSLTSHYVAYERFLPKYGYPVPTREEIRQVFPMPFIDQVRVLTKEKSEEKLAEVFRRFEQEPWPYDQITITEGVPPVLEKLQTELKLGVVTSSDSDYLGRCLAAANLTRYFPVTVTYSMTKRHKPDPEPLLLAIRKLGVEPSQTVYIGDAVTDYLAASATGAKFIFFGQALPKELEGKNIPIARSFNELNHVIKGMRSKSTH